MSATADLKSLEVNCRVVMKTSRAERNGSSFLGFHSFPAWLPHIRSVLCCYFERAPIWFLLLSFFMIWGFLNAAVP